MKGFVRSEVRMVLLGVVVGLLAATALRPAISRAAEGTAPVADAGLPRYAATDPVVLDGTASYDPDDSGPLSYQWRQLGGPPVIVSGADTATPTVGGFVQTEHIQRCEFELIVSDGELVSRPDTVKVIIVPDFGENLLELKNDSFDPEKPTLIFFGGGNCRRGLQDFARMFFDGAISGWLPEVNAIEFPTGYVPDDITGTPTYYNCGDMIIVYLSAVAPNYNQPIQISGHSTGGMPAIDVGIHLNLTYGDHRYAVNRVTFFDVACRDSGQYSSCIERFIASAVDGEQCWVDNYPSTHEMFYTNALDVAFPGGSHGIGREWYNYSLTNEDMNKFNNGVVAGAYWSVVGPGKNLQLSSTLDSETYRFRWYGGESSGYMDFFDESLYLGRLPEPVTLVGPADGAVVDANGAVLSCQESENAIGYQLLFGPDPYHMFYLFSDTPSPPNEPVGVFPFEQTWWTVRACDLYGSTIHADPMHINPENVIARPIENAVTGQTYASIQQAINDAHPGDEIVVSSGVRQYCENINFKGENLTLRSMYPNDPAVVAATIINGGHRASAVTFSGAEEAACVLDGLTITGGMVGISCRDASPTIKNCTIGGARSSIEFWHGSEPTIVDCTLLGQIQEDDPGLIAHWKLDETEGMIAHDSVGTNAGTVMGPAIWQPTGGAVDGALELGGTTFVGADFVLSPSDGPFSVLAWVNGGEAGQAIISQQAGADWLMADSVQGRLMTELKYAGRGGNPLCSDIVITDGGWHRVAFTWDGSYRTLYVDDMPVAGDTQKGLAECYGGLHIGCGANMGPGTFFTGLIDDVRIYNRAVKP